MKVVLKGQIYPIIYKQDFRSFFGQKTTLLKKISSNIFITKNLVVVLTKFLVI